MIKPTIPPQEGSTPVDPLLIRRIQLARISALGRRLGYSAFAAATGVLIFGLFTTFTNGIAKGAIGLLIGGSLVLAPAILVHYAVRGANREDVKAGD